MSEDEKSAAGAPRQVVKKPRPGRNEPCHCGSGKKYKKCHLQEDEAEDRRARQTDEAARVAEARAAAAGSADAAGKDDAHAPDKHKRDSFMQPASAKSAHHQTVRVRKTGGG